MNIKVWLVRALLGTIPVAIMASVCLIGLRASYKKETIRKGELLGLHSLLRFEIIERHVQIAEKAILPQTNGDIPVRIMVYVEGFGWRARGMGTRLGFKPLFVVSALHVFEGYSSRYGVRVIGPGEFTGENEIIPIVSIAPQMTTDMDDVITCRIDPNFKQAPEAIPILNPKSADVWMGPGNGEKISFLPWPVSVSLYTQADKQIKGLIQMRSEGKSQRFLFDHLLLQGESGVGAVVIEGNGNTQFMVLTGYQTIPENLFKALDPDVQKRANWKQGKYYGSGVLVTVGGSSPSGKKHFSSIQAPP